MSSSSDVSSTSVRTGYETGKRKRDDGSGGRTNGSTSLLVPALDTAAAAAAAAAASNDVDSPMHSPASSSGLHPTVSAANGAPSRRASTKPLRRRNIDRVQFGQYDIKTWYYSPYQFDDEEWAQLTATTRNVDATGASTSASTAATTTENATAQRQIGKLAQHHDPPINDPRSFSSGTPSVGLVKPGGALSTSADKAPVLQVTSDHQQKAHEVDEGPLAKSIWVCDGCFKYMRTYSGFRAHKRDCRFSHPPGKKVYQRGAHTIWQVDGAQEKLYAQNLSLFGKLFIDHKTIYFDVEPFAFYVLTDATSSFDHVLGYFSKEKISYDDYNLACIITFPPFQKSGFGTLMIEFSYYLSSLTPSVLGTPERPLSDLGLKGYLSFWSAVALRTLALLFNVQDPDVQATLLPATFAASTKSRHHAQSAAANAALMDERRRLESERLRKIALGLPAPRQSIRFGTQAGSTSSSTRSGWAGEATHRVPNGTAAPSTNGENGIVQREWTSVTTTLSRLAEATNLRIDDLALALSEVGLLNSPRADRHTTVELVITQNAVCQAVKRFGVKRPVMDVNYVLL